MIVRKGHQPKGAKRYLAKTASNDKTTGSEGKHECRPEFP
jgi:hypothetical protein